MILEYSCGDFPAPYKLMENWHCSLFGNQEDMHGGQQAQDKEECSDLIQSKCNRRIGKDIHTKAEKSRNA